MHRTQLESLLQQYQKTKLLRRFLGLFGFGDNPRIKLLKRYLAQNPAQQEFSYDAFLSFVLNETETNPNALFGDDYYASGKKSVRLFKLFRQPQPTPAYSRAPDEVAAELPRLAPSPPSPTALAAASNAAEVAASAFVSSPTAGRRLSPPHSPTAVAAPAAPQPAESEAEAAAPPAKLFRQPQPTPAYSRAPDEVAAELPRLAPSPPSPTAVAATSNTAEVAASAFVSSPTAGRRLSPPHSPAAVAAPAAPQPAESEAEAAAPPAKLFRQSQPTPAYSRAPDEVAAELPHLSPSPPSPTAVAAASNAAEVAASAFVSSPTAGRRLSSPHSPTAVAAPAAPQPAESEAEAEAAAPPATQVNATTLSLAVVSPLPHPSEVAEQGAKVATATSEEAAIEAVLRVARAAAVAKKAVGGSPPKSQASAESFASFRTASPPPSPVFAAMQAEAPTALGSAAGAASGQPARLSLTELLASAGTTESAAGGAGGGAASGSSATLFSMPVVHGSKEEFIAHGLSAEVWEQFTSFCRKYNITIESTRLIQVLNMIEQGKIDGTEVKNFKLIHFICLIGNLKLIENFTVGYKGMLTDRILKDLNNFPLSLVARSGNVEAMRVVRANWYVRQYITQAEKILQDPDLIAKLGNAAARSGNVDIINLAKEWGCEFTASMVDSVILSKDTDAVEFARTWNIKPSEALLIEAAKRGDATMMKLIMAWLYSKDEDINFRNKKLPTEVLSSALSSANSSAINLASDWLAWLEINKRGSLAELGPLLVTAVQSKRTELVERIIHLIKQLPSSQLENEHFPMTALIASKTNHDESTIKLLEDWVENLCKCKAISTKILNRYLHGFIKEGETVWVKKVLAWLEHYGSTIDFENGFQPINLLLAALLNRNVETRDSVIVWISRKFPEERLAVGRENLFAEPKNALQAAAKAGDADLMKMVKDWGIVPDMQVLIYAILSQHEAAVQLALTYIEPELSSEAIPEFEALQSALDQVSDAFKIRCLQLITEHHQSLAAEREAARAATPVRP